MVGVFATSALYAGELEQAANLERQGHAAEAAALYRQWLRTNPPSPQWDQVVLRAAAATSDPQQAVRELLDALPKLSTDGAKREAYLRIGRLDELLGNWTGAQESFQNASLVPGRKDYASLLQSARLLVQMGRIEEADAQARSIIATCQTPSIVSQAQALEAKIDAIEGKSAAAASVISDVLTNAAVSGLSPQTLADLYSASARLGLASQKATVAQLFEQYYPNSPERAVVSGRIAPVPSPAGLLGYRPGPYAGPPAPRRTVAPASAAAKPAGAPAAGAGRSASAASSPAGPTVAIQIGSYLDPSNAAYRLQDLEDAGFAGKVVKASVEGKTYYRVVVPGVPVGDSQHYLVRLKEKGFEGFLLYP